VRVPRARRRGGRTKQLRSSPIEKANQQPHLLCLHRNQSSCFVPSFLPPQAQVTSTASWWREETGRGGRTTATQGSSATGESWGGAGQAPTEEEEEEKSKRRQRKRREEEAEVWCAHMVKTVSSYV
jgi:hypothetical protein